jgi:hypothetical protein
VSTQVNFHVQIVADLETAKRIDSLSEVFKNGMTLSILDALKILQIPAAVGLTIRGPEVAHLYP